MDKKLESALKWITGILEDLKIPYQISGGLAAHIYRSPRPVNDIDLDMPEDRMEEIVPLVKEYIIQDLGHFKDKKWDLKLMVLDYHGQIIDIGGVENVRIYDEEACVWKPFPGNLSTSRKCQFYNIELPIMDPCDLAKYKKVMVAPGHEHHIGDIKAVEKYIKNN